MYTLHIYTDVLFMFCTFSWKSICIVNLNRTINTVKLSMYNPIETNFFFVFTLFVCLHLFCINNMQVVVIAVFVVVAHKQPLDCMPFHSFLLVEFFFFVFLVPFIVVGNGRWQWHGMTYHQIGSKRISSTIPWYFCAIDHLYFITFYYICCTFRFLMCFSVVFFHLTFSWSLVRSLIFCLLLFSFAAVNTLYF